jgi:hypothetical protein
VAIEFYGGYQVYSESGIDLTLLHRNLQQTVEDRWESTRRAAVFADALEQSGRMARHESLPTRRQFMFDPQAMLDRLIQENVQFVIVGGLAMSAHGSAYVTKDLDICYQRSAANLAALVKAFSSVHPYLRGAPPDLPFHFDVPTVQAGLNFTLATDLGDIDTLGEISDRRLRSGACPVGGADTSWA